MKRERYQSRIVTIPVDIVETFGKTYLPYNTKTEKRKALEILNKIEKKKYE